MFLFALSVCWRAPTVSLFTPSVNTEVVQTFIFCCLWVWNEPFWQFVSLTSDLLLLLQVTMQSAAERVWRLHLFVSGAKASTLQPASASWPERRMNGSEWIWSEPLWRLFVLKVLNWLTSGRLWMWGREFCSAHSRKQNCDLNWRGNFPVLMSLKRTVYSLWCQRKGPVVTYISRDYLLYCGHVSGLNIPEWHNTASFETEQFSAAIMMMISFYDWRILHNNQDWCWDLRRIIT